jgi:hypothetical protein
MTVNFAPGDLVFARGREWVTLPSADAETLCLRPLSGAEADIQVLHPALEREPVRPAQFDAPEISEGMVYATQDGALLLSEALRLSLRRGAGPFRLQPVLVSSLAPISWFLFSWRFVYPSSG